LQHLEEGYALGDREGVQRLVKSELWRLMELWGDREAAELENFVG
jgi:hypothetical protein